MNPSQSTCPAPRSRVIELYFMEHRAKLIDIAAFLDRLDRADDDVGSDDFRVEAFREAVRILLDGKPHRAQRALDVFSDPSAEPIDSAAGLKGAHGAWPGRKGASP
jgi:hypothetical protein